MHSAGSHLSKEMLDLIKSIGDSRSKQEEDKIILKEREYLKTKIKEASVNAKKMKEYLLRAIYIEMLGHEAPFAHLYAVNLTQDKNILNKRVGYLACNLLLSDSSEMLILLVASIQKDIQSKEWLEVCMALNSVIKFPNSTLMQAVFEPINKLLEHKSEQVKKKAVMCLYKFWQMNPSYVPDINEKMKRLLCDYDISVMAATLNYYLEVTRKHPENYKDLVSSFTVILKQIIEHKLPRDYDYHRFPAPWIQVKLLEILAYLGKDDQNSSENMYEILTQVLRRADDTGINIGYAIVYQCLKTICVIYPNQHLIELAASTISRFLSSDSPNLRCTGINGLALIIQINPGYVMEHQQVIVDCLEENDETLKKNTFDLLYKMTTMDNVQVIIDKMMKYLKNTSLESAGKKDILNKITELAERFAPDKGWFIKIMNQLFVSFGDLITDEILSKLIKLINEWESETDEEEFRQFTIDNYTSIIENISNLPDSLVKLIAWVFGEYGKKLYINDEEKVINLLKIIEYLLSKTFDDDMTKCMLITAITKLHSNIQFKDLDFVNNLIEKYSRDQNVEIQQRCLEYKRLMKSNTSISKNQFTTILDELDIDSSLSFLDGFIQSKIRSGAREYDRRRYEEEKNIFSKEEKELVLAPYQAPEILDPTPSANQNKFTSLYDDKQNYQKKIMSSELKSGTNVWTKEGYTGEVKKQTVVNNAFNPPGQSVSNNSQANFSSSNIFNNLSSKSGGVVTTGTGAFSGVGSGITNVGKKAPANEQFKYVPKKAEPVFDPKKEEKDLFKNSLFGGLTNKTTNTTMSKTPINAKLTANITENKTISQQQNQGNFQPQQQAQNPVDLLGLGSSSNNVNNNTQTTNNRNNNINLLDEIFSSSYNNKQNTASSNTNILDFASPNNQNKPQANQTNLFEMLGNQSKPANESIKKTDFTPVQMDTDTFGEYWTNCPNDEKSFDFVSKFVSTPQKFFDLIKSSGNFFPVEIIEDQAIACAKLKDKLVLVHATIAGFNVNVLVKCFDNTQTDLIGKFLKEFI